MKLCDCLSSDIFHPVPMGVIQLPDAEAQALSSCFAMCMGVCACVCVCVREVAGTSA